MSQVIENIFPTNMSDEVEQSFLDYAVSVITDRALPDVRDGLKPVHRRIIYAAYDQGLLSNKKYTKSAGIVGEVLKKYHPHGDTSVYDSLVRLAQDFSMRYCLIDGHGNFGSIDGDPPAHYRYTEAKMTKFAEEMVRDIKKNTVDFVPNFSEEYTEPEVLPARVPNLLLNGTTGIAVGMACSFAPHNLTDVEKAIEAYVANPDITNEELVEIIKGPDFPTGGIVINKDELVEGYKTGRGRIRIRGRYEIQTRKKRNLIVFTEIPYMTKKEKILEDIVKLCENKEIEGIADARDESDHRNALVIEVANGYDPEDIVRVLFAKTQLENTYSLNHTCLVNGSPKVLSLKDLIKYYVNFQYEVITRRTEFDLAKILSRLNVITGYIIALANIDNVIKVIKESNTKEEAKTSLMTGFELNEEQATAVLKMELYRLTKLQIDELKEEEAELTKKRNELERILNNSEELNKVFISELAEESRKFASPRRTDITQVNVVKDKKTKVEFIPKPITIGIDEDYTIKIIENVKSFKTKKNKENYQYILSTTTADSLTIFANDGKVYRIPLCDIKNDTNIISALDLQDVKIVDILTNTTKHFVLFLTKNGFIKKSNLKEYKNIKRNGTIGIKLREGDEVQKICFVDNEPVIIINNRGLTIKITTQDIAPTGRNTMGVAGMKLKENDYAVSMTPICGDKKYILTITKNGFAKKTEEKEYNFQGRNGVGAIGCKIADNDTALSILSVNENDTIIIYSQNNLIKIPCSDVPTVNKIAQGNHVAKYGNVNNINII